MNNSLKISYLSLFSAFLLVAGNNLYAQSPYSLSPQWRFGAGAGLNFTNGNFPLSGAPVVNTANPGSNLVEASTSVCDQTGAIAIYSNTMQVRNVTNSIVDDLLADNTCAASATGGGVAIPDPASPDDTYYLFVGNDRTSGGGACPGLYGINYYKYQKNGLGQAVHLSGPTNIADAVFPDESMCAGSDGQGNYWLINHAFSSNTFRVWSITASGVTALADQLKPESATTTSQSFIRLSPCQNKIAWHGGTTLVVYNFNRSTGAVGSLIYQANTGVHGAGLEFSPNGNIVYVSGQSTVVQWHNLTTSVTGTVAGSASWSMQMGPDAKIYTSPGGGNIGVIDNLDNPAAATYTTISLGTGSTYRGLMNVGWLSPEIPEINTSITGCAVDFSFVFQNYFLANISVDPASILWDFDYINNPSVSTSTNAAPTFTYGADGTYDVKLTFRDATCGHTFTATTQVTVTCGVLPPGCNYNLTAKIDPITNVDIDDKTPVTINFIGSNSIFDASTTDPEKYYWINGSADTTLAFATTANASLTFAYKGLGGNIPQGTYEIYLVTREGLCMDTTKVSFEVTYFFIPNLVTPNGDSYNDRFEISNTGGRFDIEIFNRWGEKVYNEKGYTKNWDVLKESDGIYYYEVTDTKSTKKYKGWLQITR